ncbi:hypothetical protein EVAR_60847_1 [Eumeta japonica]|uniref:Uncharacterized protein n=1 Tax=Eumeta variegata TaxID=151549 RepID=A0A4C1Y4X6_EUMVA|nr:hypothetical protein EVAR_60847_1 [Eumeta japonica]
MCYENHTGLKKLNSSSVIIKEHSSQVHDFNYSATSQPSKILYMLSYQNGTCVRSFKSILLKLCKGSFVSQSLHRLQRQCPAGAPAVRAPISLLKPFTKDVHVAVDKSPPIPEVGGARADARQIRLCRLASPRPPAVVASSSRVFMVPRVRVPILGHHLTNRKTLHVNSGARLHLSERAAGARSSFAAGRSEKTKKSELVIICLYGGGGAWQRDGRLSYCVPAGCSLVACVDSAAKKRLHEEFNSAGWRVRNSEASLQALHFNVKRRKF